MTFRKPKKKEAGSKKTGAAAEKKAGAGNLVVMFAMMMVVFLVGAGMVIGYFEFLDPDRKEADDEPKKKEIAMQSMELGDMVVNLADQDGSHFLKLTITIEYPADKKIEEKLTEKKHLVTETILLTLRSKNLSQVRPPEAIDQLKSELVREINNRLGEQAISKIYFTEYIVQ